MRSLGSRVAVFVVATSLSISSVRAGVALAATDDGGEAPSEGGHLRLRAIQPDVTFLVRTGARNLFNLGHFIPPGANVSRITLHSFEELCAAPCEVRLPPGEYVLGLKLGDSHILESRKLTLRGDETLTGTWVSRHTVRVVGGIVGAAAMLAGFVLGTRSLATCSDGTRCHQSPNLWIGLGIFVGGATTAVVTQMQDDRAEIEVAP